MSWSEESVINNINERNLRASNLIFYIVPENKSKGKSTRILKKE